ncbi:MAG TPA: hypothetical protein VI112_06835 [Bacteroidia bacterium]|jgi:sensor histidine kinase YesM
MRGTWGKVSRIGVSAGVSGEEVKYIHLVNRTAFLVCLLTPSFVPLLVWCGDVFYAKIQSGFSILFPFVFLLTRARRFRAASYCLFFLVLTNLTLASVLNYNIGSEYLILPTAMVSFMIFRKTRESLFFFCLSVFSFFLIQYLQTVVRPVVTLPDFENSLLFESILFMTFIATLLVMFNFKSVLDNYERSILAQKKTIEERNKEITDSIHYAQRIQRSLLPSGKSIARSLEKRDRAKREV